MSELVVSLVIVLIALFSAILKNSKFTTEKLRSIIVTLALIAIALLEITALIMKYIESNNEHMIKAKTENFEIISEQRIFRYIILFGFNRPYTADEVKKFASSLVFTLGLKTDDKSWESNSSIAFQVDDKGNVVVKDSIGCKDISFFASRPELMNEANKLKLQSADGFLSDDSFHKLNDSLDKLDNNSIYFGAYIAFSPNEESVLPQTLSELFRNSYISIQQDKSLECTFFSFCICGYNQTFNIDCSQWSDLPSTKYSHKYIKGDDLYSYLKTVFISSDEEHVMQSLEFGYP